MEKNQKKHNSKLFCRVFFLLLATLTYVVKVILSLYAWWGVPSNIALKVSLQSAFQEYRVPISPGEWTQVFWLVLYLWEALWMVFAWTFVCRQHTTCTIHSAFYPLYSLACLLQIGWVFAWGRLFHELSLALVAVQVLVLMVSVGVLSTYLYYIRGTLKFYYMCNFVLTRVLVLNGTIAYATFSLILMLFNLGAVLIRNADVHPDTVSTTVLSLLSSIVVTYFLLENTILDRFLRYIFTVYPVVLWTMIGILTEVWKGRQSLENRDELFALILTCVVGALSLIRVLLWFVFICIRPLPEYEKDEPETVPLQ